MYIKQLLLSVITLLVFSYGLAQEEYPEPPSPTGPQERIYEKAGLGSYIPYAKSGVVELGGSMSFVTANEFDQFTLSPSVGWFFADNLQLSAIASYHQVSTGTDNLIYWTALLEPSYHLPFNNTTFGFAGLGLVLHMQMK